MKKVLHELSGFLIVSTALLSALFLIKPELFDTVWLNWLNTWNNVFGGGLLFCIVALYWLSSGPSRPRVRFILVKSEYGEVSISVTAVRDFVRRLGEEFSSVVNLDPKVRSEKKGGIFLDLNVKVQVGSRIPELAQRLRSRVCESLQDSLGIVVDERVINVFVMEIKGSPKPTSK